MGQNDMPFQTDEHKFNVKDWIGGRQEELAHRKALVVLSGGMDSIVLTTVVNAHAALTAAVSFNYGQRHKKELQYAARTCEHLGIEHFVIDISRIGAMLHGSALTDPGVEVPHGLYDAESMKQTVVPNRNMIFMALAAGVAQANGYDSLWTGVHAGDFVIYPDCRPEFIQSCADTIALATDGAVELFAPFVYVLKSDIASIGWQAGAVFSHSWSCYEGGDKHCGACGTCVERIEAFANANVPDTTDYKDGAWFKAMQLLHANARLTNKTAIAFMEAQKTASASASITVEDFETFKNWTKSLAMITKLEIAPGRAAKFYV